MSDSTYHISSIVLWAFALAAGIGTVIIYYMQLRKMDTNIKAQKLANDTSIRAQTLAWLIQYLQSADVRRARFVVMTTLVDKTFPWEPEEQEIASTALAAYGTAAVFIELGRIDADVIIDNWGPSIHKVCQICQKLIEDRRATHGEKYWAALVKLSARVKPTGEKAVGH